MVLLEFDALEQVGAFIVSFFRQFLYLVLSVILVILVTNFLCFSPRLVVINRLVYVKMILPSSVVSIYLS